MKSKKNLIMCIIAGIISCSYTLTAGAGSFSDVNILKGGLLISNDGNSSVNILDYNTNNDNVVNVLDLCRAKKSLMEKYQVTSQHVTIEAAGPWVSADNRSLTVPVRIKGNSLGVSSVSFDIKYNDWYFTLSKVYASSKGNAVFSKETGSVQYTAPGGKNLTSEGIFVYIVFDAMDYVPDATYNVRLNNIKCAMIENESARELTGEECVTSAKLSFTYGNKSDEPVESGPADTEPLITTVPVTDAPVTTTTRKQTEPHEQNVLNFSISNAETASDGRHLRIPVYMDSNTNGFGSFSTVVKYDRNKFKLVSVERADFDGYGYVGGNSDNAVFNMNNGQNISKRSGVLAWLNFEITGDRDSREYSFELTDIKASYYENWNQKPVEKYKNRSDVYKFKFTSGNEPSETVQTTVTTSGNIPVWTEPPSTEPPVPDTTTRYEVSETTRPNPSDGSYVLNEEQLWFIDKVNEFRTQNGKPKITIINKAFKAAEDRAEMLSKSYTENLPDGRNYKWALYDNDIMPYCISQSIDNKSDTKERAWDVYITGSRQFLLDDSMYDRFAVGHYVDSGGKHYWAMFTFG